MKRLISACLILLSLTMGGLAHAEDDFDPDNPFDRDAPKSTESFDVLNILNVDQGDLGTSNLNESLRETAEEEGTSLVGALILRVINILSLLVGSFAFIMIVIGGFIFVTSGGNEAQTDKGKSILSQAILTRAASTKCK